MDKRLEPLLSGKLDPETFGSVEDWVRQCFNRPSGDELVMEAANEILGGFGVEGIQIEGAWVDSHHFDIVASYVNMGDTYDATLVLDHETGEYLWTSWGDYVEGYEQEQD